MDGPGSGGKAPRRSGAPRSILPYGKDSRQGPPPDEKIENKLYVGNLDHRVTEYHVLKLFNPFGKIKREEFLWHTHGPKRGEPRGYAFVEYSNRADAERARAEMNGKPAFGRPLVVRFVDEKVATYNQDAPVWTRDGAAASSAPKAETKNNVSKSAKIAAIQSKLRMMEQEDKMKKAAEKPPPSLLPSSSSGLADGSTHWNPPPPAASSGDGRSGTGGQGDQRAHQSRTLLQSGNRWSAWG